MQIKDVKVSVIILDGSNQILLRECVNSILAQSLYEIEVICADNTFQSLAETDGRLKIIKHENDADNFGLGKEAVLLSEGEYVLFVNGNIKLMPDACEKLYNEIKKEPVDILQFGADLWDKLYAGNCCRKAAGFMADRVPIYIQDKCAYFFISYFSGSSRSIQEKYYIDCFIGKTSEYDAVNLPLFERYCSVAIAIDTIETFIDEKKEYSYKSYVIELRQQMLDAVIKIWGKLRKKDCTPGLDIILHYWKDMEVIETIARNYWDKPGMAAEMVSESKRMKIDWHKGIKTISTYYSSISGGGAQRVTALLANIWHEMGYEVVLFTDMPETENDYCLAPGIKRVILPMAQGIQKEDYLKRAEVLRGAIKQYKIDVMVYHAWGSAILLWDMMVCKLTGTAFIVHCHTIFFVALGLLGIEKIYKLCDGVVTLSEVDYCFWKNFNKHVFITSNPLFFDIHKIQPSTLKENNIVWLARFSKEKHPMDAIYIFKKINNAMPDARLYMVGKISEEDRIFYGRKIDELGIANSVEICGYLNDVSPILSKASVQLITSEFEGFSLALLEGMAYGIPCVMYRLPYLSLVKNNKSVISVDYEDIDEAANSVLEILSNTERKKELGNFARKYAEKIAEFDVATNWNIIFKKITRRENEAEDSTEQIMVNTLLDYYEKKMLFTKDGIRPFSRAFSKLIGNKQILTRKIVFWGSGQRARRFLKLYPELHTEFCIDNDEKKEGTSIEGVPIVHPGSIAEWGQLFIIITVLLSDTIRKQLENLGLVYEEDFILSTDILT